MKPNPYIEKPKDFYGRIINVGDMIEDADSQEKYIVERLIFDGSSWIAESGFYEYDSLQYSKVIEGDNIYKLKRDIVKTITNWIDNHSYSVDIVLEVNEWLKRAEAIFK